MKRFLALILALALTIGLCACGNQSDNQEPLAVDITDETLSADIIAAIRAAYDKAAAFVEANFDTENLEISEQDDAGGAYLYKYWNSTGDTANADFTNDIEIDGAVITLGKTTVRELKELDGFEVELSQDTVEPNSILGFGLSKGNKSCMLSTAANNTDKAAPVDDFTVDQIAAAYSDFSLPFRYSGLDEKSTVKDVIEKVGMPNNSIQISVDEQTAAIDLNYSRTSDADGLVIDDSLSISLSYNADTDTAAVSAVRLGRNTFSE